MKNLSKVLAVSTFSLIAAQANAATYNVSGDFETGTANGLELSLGGLNTLENGSTLSFGGQVVSDGTTITGGTVTMTGTQMMNPTGVPITITINATGTASDLGVLFDSGTICVTALTACDSGYEILGANGSGNTIDMRSGAMWGFFSAVGLQLDGTNTSPSYSVAQPGLTFPDAGGADHAVGALHLLGGPAAIFLSGDLTFSEVPVPAAAWLFGSALLGLAGMKRKQ